MDPKTLRSRPEPTRPTPDRRTHRSNHGAAILILGSCREDAFVADHVVIEAATLGAEAAIHAWLREHDIRFAASPRGALSEDGRAPR
jgi:hypothetical protein